MVRIEAHLTRLQNTDDLSYSERGTQQDESGSEFGTNNADGK